VSRRIERWLYVAGPFRRVPPAWLARAFGSPTADPLPAEIGESLNVKRAAEVARELLPLAEQHGVGVLVPHLVGQAGLGPCASEQYWVELTLDLLARLCVDVYATVGARTGALVLSYPVADALDSSGTRGELAFAVRHDLAVYDRDGSLVDWSPWGEIGKHARRPFAMGPVRHPPTVAEWIRGEPR
jgi:hypothetical protein